MYINGGRKKEDERQIHKRDGDYKGDFGALHLPSRLHSVLHNMLSMVRSPQPITANSFVESKARISHQTEVVGKDQTAPTTKA